MAEFLRQPKNRDIKDGESFVDIKDGECIAQIAKKNKDGKIECIEVRKSVRTKDGGNLTSDKRNKIIEECKAEAEKKYKAGGAVTSSSKKSSPKKSSKKSTKTTKKSTSSSEKASGKSSKK